MCEIQLFSYHKLFLRKIFEGFRNFSQETFPQNFIKIFIMEKWRFFFKKKNFENINKY